MLLVIAVLIPLISGVAMVVTARKVKFSRLFTETVVLASSLLVWYILLTGYAQGRDVNLFFLTGNLSVNFNLDATGRIFAGLVSFLWPLATLYAFEYMEEDEHQQSFFGFYTMTFGVTLGIAFSGNLLSLYFFYEMLTLVTFPLVLHYRNKESRVAARKYLYYSIGGAAFAFIGLVFIILYGTSTDFILGGVLDIEAVGDNTNTVLAMFLMAFFGFGVKAAVFPVYKWLPTASVAPTPVTALLHAVAVVKSGAFAIIRLIYFSYGAAFIRGTWAHYVVAAFVIFTVAFGSTMAVKEIHFKRRLAYSTVANLSYILLGAVMMNRAGLYAALSHMVIHAIMKICAFFCAGAVMHKAHKNYVYELNGLARKMPVTFACFTVASMSLAGIPMFAGFISKWNIAQAAVAEGSVLGVIAVAALLYSALMTSIYTMTVVIRAYFPGKDFDYKTLEGIHDPGWHMLVPIALFAVMLVAIGLYSNPIMTILRTAADGGII